jgi:hypothetical protein
MKNNKKKAVFTTLCKYFALIFAFVFASFAMMNAGKVEAGITVKANSGESLSVGKNNSQAITKASNRGNAKGYTMTLQGDSYYSGVTKSNITESDMLDGAGFKTGEYICNASNKDCRPKGTLGRNGLVFRGLESQIRYVKFAYDDGNKENSAGNTDKYVNNKSTTPNVQTVDFI